MKKALAISLFCLISIMARAQTLMYISASGDDIPLKEEIDKVFERDTRNYVVRYFNIWKRLGEADKRAHLEGIRYIIFVAISKTTNQVNATVRYQVTLKVTKTDEVTTLHAATQTLDNQQFHLWLPFIDEFRTAVTHLKEFNRLKSVVKVAEVDYSRANQNMVFKLRAGLDNIDKVLNRHNIFKTYFDFAKNCDRTDNMLATNAESESINSILTIDYAPVVEATLPYNTSMTAIEIQKTFIQLLCQKYLEVQASEDGLRSF